ncbi:MAG: hypothetical protein WD773_01950 [Gemmatimonadales bacterium]
MKASIWLLAALLAACEHSTPFRPGNHGPDGPLNPGPLTRLTFNPGEDLIPVWLPDGSGIVYTAERRDRADHDRCLAFLPASGGAISHYLCPSTAADDSVHIFEDAASRIDGRVAFVRVASDLVVAGRAPDTQALMLGSADGGAQVVVHSLPLTTPWGRTYDGISHLGWLDSSRLIIVGERLSYPRPCTGCARDTARTGLEVAILDVTTPVPVFALVPGTDNASSVAADATGDTLYFTRIGDTRLYRNVRSSGRADTIYDFGGAGIARDVAVKNGRLAAIVGGAVSYVPDSVLGVRQVDRGGFLYLLDPAGGGPAVQLGGPGFVFKRPAFSPDGTRMVVAAVDSVSTTADLWLMQLP